MAGLYDLFNRSETMRLIQEGPTRLGGIMVVGEAPGEAEARFGRPFVGLSGHELDHQFGLAGIDRRNCFLTNVCHERPPGNEIEAFFSNKTKARKAPLLDKPSLRAATAMVALGADPNEISLPEVARLGSRAPHAPVLRGLLQLQHDIDRLRPSLIIALGNTALWALTGFTGITKWRGSILPAEGGPVDGYGTKLIPTMHPAAVVRERVWRAVAIQDLRRAVRESAFSEIRRPSWNFHVPNAVSEVRDWLHDYVFSSDEDHSIVADVENFYETDRVHKGRIICLGFAFDQYDAMCVPFTRRTGDSPHWWRTADEEAAVIQLCREALTARPITFHNGTHDVQILARNWGVMPKFTDDTMVMQHVAFPGQLGGKIDPITGKVSKRGSSLSLAFCSSMYCNYHRWWKDDGKGWDPEIHDETQYWDYCCEDTVRTWEVRFELERVLRQQGLWDQYRWRMELFEPVFEMMFQGIRFDDDRRRKFAKQVANNAAEVQKWIDIAVGHKLNVGSSTQMRDLFYHDLQIPLILHRKTKQPTLDDRALTAIIKRRPVLRPLIEHIQGLRSLGVFKENFLDLQLSDNGRLRWSYNVAGPETMRFSSNINAFGEGCNLQNLPRSEE